jgi:UDPglucose--hexose-1-phosphate uridylyltransferase
VTAPAPGARTAAPGFPGLQVVSTSVRLSDGRELVYFDERPGRRRGVADSRGLARVAQPPSDVRYDPITDQWVVIASHRQTRTHLPAADECPLCPSRPGRATEVPEDYDVVVFENRFPALSDRGLPDLGLVGSGLVGSGLVGPGLDGPGLDGSGPAGPMPSGPGGDVPGPQLADAFARRPGAGRCEVVCFTAEHDTSFAYLTPHRVATVLAAWTHRTAALSARPGVEYVFAFENRGEEIGVTLRHPHGQIYAYPFVPPSAAEMIRVARAHGRCLHCAAIENEAAAGVRVVAETDSWLAFVPYAARWPFELSIYPRRHVPDLLALDDRERSQFPEFCLDLLRRFDGIFDVPMPYIAGWEQAPVRVGRRWSHLRLRVVSNRRAPTKLKYLAGSESVMGVFINDVVPERAAELLRAALPSGQPSGPRSGPRSAPTSARVSTSRPADPSGAVG